MLRAYEILEERGYKYIDRRNRKDYMAYKTSRKNIEKAKNKK